MMTAPETRLSIQVRKTPQAIVLDLQGPLYLGESSAMVIAKIKELLAEGHRQIVLNMTGVPKLDSSGMGALVQSHTSARNAGGRLKLYGLTKQVVMILEMVRLMTVLEIYPDEATALASF